MIALAVNNTMLDVGAGLRISMQEAFAFDEFLSIPGEHSWRFSLPKTPGNRRAFGFADVPEVFWDPATSYGCSIYVDGRVFKSGRLYIEGDTDLAFEVYFVGTVGALKEKIKGAKINEMAAWPEITGISNMFDYADAEVSNATALLTFAEVSMPNGDFPMTFINVTDSQRTVTGVWEGFDRTGINPMCPFVFVRTFWSVLKNEYDLSIDSDFLDDAEIDSLIFFNLRPLNLVNASGEYTQTFPAGIKLKEHVPDMAVEEFLTNFSKLFNLLVLFDAPTNTLRIVPRSSLFNLPRVVLNERVERYQTVFEQYKTYSLRYVFDEEELSATPDWAGTLEGINGTADSEVVESQIATLPMWDRDNDGEWHIPVTINRLGDNPGVRLLFYRGLQNTYTLNPAWGPMPLATSDNRYTTGFNYALTWKDAAGLYAQWWQPWLDVTLRGRTLRVWMWLTSAELAEFNPLSVWVIDGWRCFVKKLSYEISENRTLVEAEVLKI